MATAIYTRVSTSKQETDGASLDAQLDSCKFFIEKNDLEEASEQRIYREVYSGANLYDRPELTKLRAAVARGEAINIVIYAFDRLTRKQAHIGMLLTEVERAGGRIFSATEDNEQGSMADFLRMARTFVAEVEREKILERTHSGRMHRVMNQGKPLPAARALYGYEWDGEKKERLVANPETSKTVVWLYEQIDSGRSARSLCLELQRRGVPTASGRAGAEWTSSIIGTIIRNKAYKGQYEALRYTGYRNRKRQLTEGIILEGVAEPLVTPELWLAAVDALDGCPYHTMNTDILDREVWQTIADGLSNEQLLRLRFEERNEVDPTAYDREIIETRLRAIASEEKQFNETIGKITNEVVLVSMVERVNALGEQRVQLESDLQLLEEKRAEWQSTQNRIADVLAWCAAVKEHVGDYDDVPYDMKRHVLHALDVRVRLWKVGRLPRRWEMEWNLPVEIVKGTS